MVGDAKWKRLITSGPSLGLKAADLYQLTAYMVRHGLNKGILFFPITERLDSRDKPWLRRFFLADRLSTITVISVDIVGLVARNAEQRKRAMNELKRSIFSAVQTVSPQIKLEPAGLDRTQRR